MNYLPENAWQQQRKFTFFQISVIILEEQVYNFVVRLARRLRKDRKRTAISLWL